MRRITPIARTGSTREPKRKFIIYTEGKNTEPDYFRSLERVACSALIDIEVVDAAGTPRTIAEKATRKVKELHRRHKKASFVANDVVWAVFDRDEHPHFSDALQMCRNGKVGLAVSDPCFELWLMLHFQEFDRPCHRHELQKELGGVWKGYDYKAGKTSDCRVLIENVEGAEKRAERQLARREEEGGENSPPYTTAFKLTRALRMS